jgi:hypothetical protein
MSTIYLVASRKTVSSLILSTKQGLTPAFRYRRRLLLRSCGILRARDMSCCGSGTVSRTAFPRQPGEYTAVELIAPLPCVSPISPRKKSGPLANSLFLDKIYFKNQTPAQGSPHPAHLPLPDVLSIVIDSFTSATERHIEVRFRSPTIPIDDCIDHVPHMPGW